MKLILAIVNDEDGNKVINELSKNGFSVTKLATTGGFLKAGNTTLICGVEDSKVDQAISLISEKSSCRTQVVPSTMNSIDAGIYSSFPVEVTVGGATIFVLDVERFEKI